MGAWRAWPGIRKVLSKWTVWTRPPVRVCVFFFAFFWIIYVAREPWMRAWPVFWVVSVSLSIVSSFCSLPWFSGCNHGSVEKPLKEKDRSKLHGRDLVIADSVYDSVDILIKFKNFYKIYKHWYEWKIGIIFHYYLTNPRVKMETYMIVTPKFILASFLFIKKK